MPGHTGDNTKPAEVLHSQNNIQTGGQIWLLATS